MINQFTHFTFSAVVYSVQDADLKQRFEAAGKAEIKTAEQGRDRVLQAVRDRAA
jgi:hypothetical protein